MNRLQLKANVNDDDDDDDDGHNIHILDWFKSFYDDDHWQPIVKVRWMDGWVYDHTLYHQCNYVPMKKRKKKDKMKDGK